jgi:hypothetical protein
VSLDLRVRAAFARLTLALNPHQRRGPDGRWIKGGGLGGPSAAPAPTRSGRNRTDLVWDHQIDQLLAEVGDDDSERAEYIRRALRGKREFGNNGLTYVARDEQTGELTGATTVVVREPEDPGDPSTAVIDYLGAQEGSRAGTDLVRQVLNDMQGSDAVYVEPTAASIGFWEKLGFELDPLDLGSDFLGLDTAGIQKWLRDHPKGPLL